MQVTATMLEENKQEDLSLDCHLIVEGIRGCRLFALIKLQKSMITNYNFAAIIIWEGILHIEDIHV